MLTVAKLKEIQKELLKDRSSEWTKPEEHINNAKRYVIVINAITYSNLLSSMNLSLKDMPSNPTFCGMDIIVSTHVPEDKVYLMEKK